jgi:hypothetical protein
MMPLLESQVCYVFQCAICGDTVVAVPPLPKIKTGENYASVCPACVEEFSDLHTRYKNNPAVFGWFAYHIKLYRRLTSRQKPGQTIGQHHEPRYIRCCVCGCLIEMPGYLKVLPSGQFAHMGCLD